MWITHTMCKYKGRLYILVKHSVCISFQFSVFNRVQSILNYNILLTVKYVIFTSDVYYIYENQPYKRTKKYIRLLFTFTPTDSTKNVH